MEALSGRALLSKSKPFPLNSHWPLTPYETLEPHDAHLHHCGSRRRSGHLACHLARTHSSLGLSETPTEKALHCK